VTRGRILVALAVFAAVVALTFPTDALVRWALVRALLPGGPRVEYGRATLRPWGIRLEPVTFRDAVGYRLAVADRLTARPSLRGLLSDGTGRPWHATAAAYGGTFTALVDRETIEVAWRDVDLARVPGLAVAGERLAGSAGGGARLTGTPPAGTGTLEVQATTWPGVARLLVGPEAMGIAATASWTLAGGQLALDAVAGHGAGVEARGAGSVRLASPLGRSALDVHVTLVPGPDTSAGLRRLIADLPAAAGSADARRVAISGTLDAPRAEGVP